MNKYSDNLLWQSNNNHYNLLSTLFVYK